MTVPHKAEAAKLVDDPSEAVVKTGACNTFWLEGGRIRGENTDVTGFRGAVRSLLGRGAEGMRVLLRGAGGAARGALFALIQDGVDEVVLWNRTPERAERIAEGLGAGVARVARSATELGGAPFDLVVNATSLGLGVRDPLPVDPERLRDPGALLDLVYQPAETELVRRARELGIPAADGGEMLVLQGAAAFELWWDRAAPLAVMREALAQARGDIAGVAGA